MADVRIIFLNRVYWPATAATAQLLTDLAEGLARKGWPVHVITAGKISSSQHQGVTIHRTNTSDQHGGLLSKALNHRKFVRAASRQLLELIRPGDIVIPMTDPPMLGTKVAQVAGPRGLKVIHWIQDIYPEIAKVHFGTVAGYFLSILKASRDASWLSANNCVTLGEDMARMITQQGIPAERVSQIPNWAPRELHVPASSQARTACRTQWGLTDKFVVAYSGNLGRVHEFATILEAAGRLRNNPAIVIVFIGQGARFDDISTTVHQRGLTNVRLLPPSSRENLAASLAAADAQLVTLHEAYSSLVYPSKLAGALAAGRPTLFVGSPQGDIARFLQREDCGAAVAPGEGARLASVIAQWQADAELRSRLGANARMAYERHFTYESSLTQWDGLLRHLTNEGQDRFAIKDTDSLKSSSHVAR